MSERHQVVDKTLFQRDRIRKARAHRELWFLFGRYTVDMRDGSRINYVKATFWMLWDQHILASGTDGITTPKCCGEFFGYQSHLLRCKQRSKVSAP